MAGSSVPKFGNWDNEDDVPYTVYFDKARKNRGGKMINPNDPQENPEMFPSKPPSAATSTPPTSKPRVQSEEPTGYGAVRATDKRPVSKEDGDLNQQYASSPARNNDNMERRRRASESAARPARQSAGSDRSFDKSPLHPVHQVKASAGRGSGSPAREGKYSYDSSSHGTPGRSYGTPGRSYGTPGRSYDSSQGGAGRTRPKPESVRVFTIILFLQIPFLYMRSFFVIKCS